MTACEALNRFNAASKTIKQILNLNYKKIIMDSEIDDSVDPVIESNKVYLKSQIKRYAKWWAVIASTFVISFLVAYCIVGNSKPTASLNDDIKCKAVSIPPQSGGQVTQGRATPETRAVS